MHWRDVDEEGNNNKNTHTLTWEIYVKEKKELIKIEFLVAVLHMKEGNIVWTCVKDNIIDKKEKCETIGLHGFDCKSFEEEEGGGTREGLDGYTYLNYIIQLWPGDWVKQMPKMNEAVGMKNLVTMDGGGKLVFCPFRRQELWKCIGCVLLTSTFRKKGHKLWNELPTFFGNTAPTKTQRDVCGNTDLYKVCGDFYCPFYIYTCH